MLFFFRLESLPCNPLLAVVAEDDKKQGTSLSFTQGTLGQRMS
jgi:hypothetical protein